MKSDVFSGALSDFSQDGFFRGPNAGRYSIEVTAYEGLDFSRRCFVLSGQSSAHPGMFKNSVAAEASLLKRLKEGDELALSLGLPEISRYVTAPESLRAEDLARSKNPALFSIEVGLCESIFTRNVHPAVLTSHSFGEYAALVVSGIARFEDIFKLVAARDEFSPPARQLGAMIVANAEPAALAGALKTEAYFLSNTNSPIQTVISVEPKNVEQILATLKKFRIAAKILSEMLQPYHSPLMEGVSEKLASYLQEQKFRFTAPHIPVISSVTGDLITHRNFVDIGGAKFIERLLARQVCEPVRFVDQIQSVLNLGVLNFTEVGPSEVCSQFVKETLANKVFKISPLSRFIETEKVVKRAAGVTAESSGILNKLSKVIASVTGYKVDEISIQDNFQEDLGIDSIRKAEIVFKFMESMKDPSQAAAANQINLAQIRSVEDVIEHFEKAEVLAASQNSEIVPPRFERYEERWVTAPIFDFERLAANDLKFGDVRILALEELNEDFHLESLSPRALLILTAGASRLSFSENAHELYERRLLPLIRAFRSLHAADRARDVRIALVHEPGADPALLALDGFFKSWFRENSFEGYRFMEFDRLPDRNRLGSIVREDFADARFNTIRYRGFERFAKVWTPSEKEVEMTLPRRPVILSLGGGRGIGAAILEKLAEARPEAKIVVMGRSPREKVAGSLEKIAAHGPSVFYVQADVLEESALTDAIRVLNQEHGSVDLLLCGAGKELSRSLKNKTDDEIREEFEGKVSPAATIYRAAHEYKIKRILNYSSIAAEFGNVGQSIYALGNRIMSGLGHMLNEKNLSQVTSLILPPWENLGMTENPLILNALKAHGVTLMPKERGVELVLGEALGFGGQEVAFLDSNDSRAYDADLVDRSAVVDLFGGAVSTLKPIEIPTLNLAQQAYLNDHIVKGNAIYPGSSALALMFYAAYLYFRKAPVIENFEIVSFLAPHANRSDVRLEIKRSLDGRLRLALSSSRAIHYRCEALSEDESVFTASGPKFERDREIAVRPLYSSKNMIFGPHFQLANELWFDRDRNVLHLTRAERLMRYTHQTVFDRLQQWFESTLQAVGGQLLWKTQHQWIPSRIGRLRSRFDRPITGELHHRAEILEVREDVSRSRAWTQNLLGEILFEMQGVEDIDLGRNQGDGQFFTRLSPEESWSHEDIGMS